MNTTQRIFVSVRTLFSCILARGPMKSIVSVELAVSVTEQSVDTDAAISSISTMPSSTVGRPVSFRRFGTM